MPVLSLPQDEPSQDLGIKTNKKFDIEYWDLANAYLSFLYCSHTERFARS